MQTVNSIKSLILLAAAATFLTGCVTGNVKSNEDRMKEAYGRPYISQSDMSFASNVLAAGKVKGVKDVKMSHESSISSNVLGATMVFSATLNNTYDVGNLGSGLIGFLSFLGSKSDAAVYNHIIAWSDSPFDIPSFYKSLISKLSSHESMNGQLTPYALKNMSKNYNIYGLKYVSDDCKDPVKEKDFWPDCGISFVENMDLNSLVKNPEFYGTSAAAFPDFIQSRNKLGYIFKMSFTVSVSPPFSTGVAIKADLLEAFVSLSKSLSPNTYIYLSPTHYTVKDKTGNLKIGHLPLVLNSGKIHAFAKPNA